LCKMMASCWGWTPTVSFCDLSTEIWFLNESSVILRSYGLWHRVVWLVRHILLQSSGLSHDDGGRKSHRNMCVHQQDSTVSEIRKKLNWIQTRQKSSIQRLVPFFLDPANF